MAISANAKFYSSIPDPQPTLEGLQTIVQAIKNNVEILTWQRAPTAAHAVSLQDLLDLGLLDTVEPLVPVQSLVLRSMVATGSIGYTTGAGGTVAQATSKSTGVTLDKTCGTITMDGAALAADATVSFVLTNSTISATDFILLSHASAGTPGKYVLNGRAAAGSATIDVTNISAGSLSEAIVIRFLVLKAVVS